MLSYLTYSSIPIIKGGCCGFVRFLLIINDANFKGLNLTSQRLAHVYKSFKSRFSSRATVIGQSTSLNRLVSSANNLMLLFMPLIMSFM